MARRSHPSSTSSSPPRAPADETALPDADPLPDVLMLDPAHVESAVLQRLIREVQHDASLDAPDPLRAYDRVHNRYNRQGGSPYDRVHNRHNRGR